MVLRKLISKGAKAFTRGSANRPVVPSGIMVSVIVPVYNTEAYLPQMLDSLASQDMPANEFEVVAVDDGSTDTSGVILDEYATRFPNIRVFHQANSGWAGKPRNVALDHSRGRYVFFADADDLLAPHALRRMVEFAEDNKLDVVMPKVVGIGGRKQTSSLYSKTDPSVTPLQALKSMTPQKLVARSLIEQNELRFAEEPVRLEDGMFMVACYLKARGIGVIAESDFYSLRQRADGSNISYRPLVPHEYSDSIGKIGAIIKGMAKNQDLEEAMLLSLWKRKGLKIYEPPRFRRYSPKIQAQWLEAHAALLELLLPAELSERLSSIHHAKTEAIRRGDLEVVLATNQLEANLAQTVCVSGATTIDGNLHLTGRVSGEGIEKVRISAEQRGKRGKICAEATLQVEDGQFSGDIPGALRGDEIFDFFVESFMGNLQGTNRRLPSDPGQFTAGKLLEPYMTKNGYFSVRSSAENTAGH